MAPRLSAGCIEEHDTLTDIVWQGALARTRRTVSGTRTAAPATFRDPCDTELRADSERALAVVTAAATRMRAESLVVLPFTVVPQPALDALIAGYRRWAEAGMMRRGDAQNPARVVAHDDPFARGMQAGFVDLVTRVSGCALAPSYAYTALYDDDSTIALHRDRAQCEVTLAVCLATARVRGPGSCLVLAREGIEVLVPARSGGAVLFRGTELVHGRVDVGAGAAPAIVLLHYVRADFTGTRD